LRPDQGQRQSQAKSNFAVDSENQQTKEDAQNCSGRLVSSLGTSKVQAKSDNYQIHEYRRDSDGRGVIAELLFDSVVGK
jgi:hypothetical protein